MIITIYYYNFLMNIKKSKKSVDPTIKFFIQFNHKFENFGSGRNRKLELWVDFLLGSNYKFIKLLKKIIIKNIL